MYVIGCLESSCRLRIQICRLVREQVGRMIRKQIGRLVIKKSWWMDNRQVERLVKEKMVNRYCKRAGR
jgi:hypothetical protein